MPLRDDIVKGARIGLILLALLLAAYVAYRRFHDTLHAAAMPAVRASGLPVPAPAPAPVPVRVTEAAQEVPSPPPPERTVHKAARPARPAAAPVEAVMGAARAEIAVKDEPDAAPPPHSSEGVSAPASEPEKAPAVEPASIPQAEESQPKSTSRGRRLMKAVGRWLHMGRKE